jgi:hypothetical protein
LTLRLNHKDNETRAVEPPAGIGTARPMLIKPSKGTFSRSLHGAMIFTSWPSDKN